MKAGPSTLRPIPTAFTEMMGCAFPVNAGPMFLVRQYYEACERLATQAGLESHAAATRDASPRSSSTKATKGKSSGVESRTN